MQNEIITQVEDVRLEVICRSCKGSVTFTSLNPFLTNCPLCDGAYGTGSTLAGNAWNEFVKRSKDVQMRFRLKASDSKI